MNIQHLAVLLLIVQLVSQFFIILVIKRQWQLRKVLTHPRLMQMRKVLALLALAVFVGNIYPLALNIYTLFSPAIRSTQQIKPAGVIYSLDTTITFLVASILIWTLYKLADVVIEVSDLLPQALMGYTSKKK